MKKENLVFVLIILFVIFTIFLLILVISIKKPISSNVIGFDKYTKEAICKAGYISLGKTCCKDSDDNYVCDKDEIKTKTTYIEYPITRTSRSDSQANPINQGYSDFSAVFSKYSNNMITIKITNNNDTNFLIKSIQIDGCNKIYPNEIAPRNDFMYFVIPCKISDGTSFKKEIIINYNDERIEKETSFFGTITVSPK